GCTDRRRGSAGRRNHHIVFTGGQGDITGLCLEGHIGKRRLGGGNRRTGRHHVDIHITGQGRAVNQTYARLGSHGTVVIGQQQRLDIRQGTDGQQAVGHTIAQGHIGINHRRGQGTGGGYLEVVGIGSQVDVAGRIRERQVADSR